MVDRMFLVSMGSLDNSPIKSSAFDVDTNSGKKRHERRQSHSLAGRSGDTPKYVVFTDPQKTPRAVSLSPGRPYTEFYGDVPTSFDPVTPRRRHERRPSSSAVGRAGASPTYTKLDTTYPRLTNMMEVAMEHTDHCPEKAASTFETKEQIPKQRHLRSLSGSLAGRSGASPAYATIRGERVDKVTRLRRRIFEVVEKGQYLKLAEIYIEQRTELPLTNREVWQIRKKVTLAMRKHLSHALRSDDPGELARVMKVADGVQKAWPYCKELGGTREWLEATQPAQGGGTSP